MINPSEIAFRYTTVLLMMFIDIISGIVKVKRTRKKFQSARMANGLYKKMGTLLCMAAAEILSVIAVKYIGIEISITKPVYIYVVAMECISVYENCGQAGLLEIIKKVIERFYNHENNE